MIHPHLTLAYPIDMFRIKALMLTRRFQEHRESGLGTLEIVLISGVLLAVALLFNKEIRDFAEKLFRHVFNDRSIIRQIQ